MGESGCLDDDAALGFAEGRGSPSERAAGELHLDTCAACRQLVSSLARLARQSRQSRQSRHEAPAIPTETGAPRPAHRRLAQGELVGRFLVLQPIGVGGMGIVYSAFDPELDRKVALKLLFGPATRAGCEGQLIREAKAMARVMHPNVVAIHEVGTHGEQVFLAMEFVDGKNLRHWLEERKRSTEEILAAFVASARGLAAAHAASLVHRDFKPDNVLVANDGQAKVTDFGLASAPRAADSAVPASASDISGTPGYMSPEQWEGAQVDARSDQYSFAISLFEALHGRLPPDPRRRVDVSHRRGVPRVVRSVLSRALRHDPAARFPSMQHLIDELVSVPRRRRRNVVVATALTGILTLAVTLGYRARVDRNQCMADRLADIWNPSTKDAIRRRFEQTGAPFATDAWRGVERSVDTFARAFVTDDRETCAATRVRHEQSEGLLALRSGCLDRRREELRALLEIFADADATAVEHAVGAAGKLTPLEACKSSDALTMQPLPPTNPYVRASVQQLRAELDAIKALLDAGRYRDGLPRAVTAVATASALGYLPVRAEALYLEGALRDESSDAKGAEARLYEAAQDAEASRHDEIAAKARSLLVWVVGFRLARHEVAEALARVAHAAIARAGARPDLAAPLENSLGTLYWAEGKYDLARERHEEARALWEKALGPENVRVADSINNRALSLWSGGHLEEALAAHEQALAMRVKLLGSEHPAVAASLNNLGLVAQDLGQFERAAEQHRRAIAIEERFYGREHPVVANAYNNLGLAELGLGQNEAALRSLSHAREIREHTRGDGHPDVANSLVNLALAYTALHRMDEALRAIEDGHARQARALGEAHPALVETLLVHALVLRRRGRPQESLTRAIEAESLAERSLGAAHPLAFAAKAARGIALVALGKAAAAIPLLESVTARADLHDAAMVGEAAFALARARAAVAQDDPGIRAATTLAGDKLRLAGPRASDLLVGLAAWTARR